ncbi:MAG: DUF359 domain-containing protein [Candidatus Thermoplasmatota archaeon]|nr:DUF359 domain-containing protein [Candidatus Thermoplasmatota archaeon]
MIDPEIPNTDLRLSEEDREELKETLGTVIKGKLPDRFVSRDPLIAVGDVVTDILLEQGVEPDVSIVDGKTRRGRFDKRGWEEKTINIKNPPEVIKQESWSVIQEAISSEDKELIKVEGEEDLLSLVAIALCPLGGLVIYGVPSEGMVINEVSEDIKEKTWEVINKMKEVDEGR